MINLKKETIVHLEPNCWNCRYRIQGEGSVVCCHPEGNKKYIYPYLEDKCEVPNGFVEIENKNQQERYKGVAKEVGWIFQIGTSFNFYKPNI